MAMVDVDTIADCRWTSDSTRLAAFEGRWPAGAVLHSSNEPHEHSTPKTLSCILRYYYDYIRVRDKVRYEVRVKNGKISYYVRQQP